MQIQIQVYILIATITTYKVLYHGDLLNSGVSYFCLVYTEVSNPVMVSDIPYLVVEEVCRLLNVESAVGSDFRRLAGELGMKISDVWLLSQKDNPTEEVLKWWIPQKTATVNKFREILIGIERHDVLGVLDGDEQPEKIRGKKYNY